MKPDTQDDFDLHRIDAHDLPGEWVRHVEFYYQYARQLADARNAYEQAKAEEKVVLAEVGLEARSDPAKFGLAKSTESSIEAAVTLDRRAQRARTQVLQAKHHLDVFQAMIDTLEHRKKALEAHVQLAGMEYFAAPRVKGAAAEEVREQVKRTTRAKQRIQK